VVRSLGVSSGRAGIAGDGGGGVAGVGVGASASIDNAESTAAAVWSTGESFEPEEPSTELRTNLRIFLYCPSIANFSSSAFWTNSENVKALFDAQCDHIHLYSSAQSGNLSNNL
jgi:hypothetical protein